MKTKLLCLTFICFACTSNVTGPEEKGELSRSLSTTETKLVEADNSFSFRIFQQLNESEDNMFISPLSVSLALGMTLNGAKNETYEEMRQTLALQDIELAEINQGYESLVDLLTGADPKVKMKIANSVWIKEGITVREDFKQRLKEYFSAESKSLDFDDPKSVDIINDWVKNNTNGLITKIMDSIPSYDIMYLINAIYFKGDWLYAFEEKNTMEETFYQADGTQISTKLMTQKSEFPTYFSDEVHMIDLPYGDSLFSMTVMMPADKETPLNEFIANDLTQQNFSNWVSQLTVSEALLKLPKFEMEYKKSLKDVLIEMGMVSAFDSGADLSGINSNLNLFISSVKHKTYITVDEKGTEAAAVTSVGIGVTSLPAYDTMIVNRPFVFIIREQNSDAILFMGKVNSLNE